MKGFTYVELVIVLGLILIIIGIIIGVVKIQNYFKVARDLQRLQDLNLLNSALNFYFQNAVSIDPDGPNLENRGIDESSSTIFVSVPRENDQFPDSYSTNSKTYYIYQANKNDYRKINGSGWIPINFLEVNFPNLSSLPADPINRLQSGLYYLYAFQRKPPQYEISAGFESTEFQKGGSADRVFNDGGDDENRFELGSNLNLIPAFIFSF
jgi:type II secretory pathway pseudopilin PulG